MGDMILTHDTKNMCQICFWFDGVNRISYFEIAIVSPMEAYTQNLLFDVIAR
jgi:hypothetical protein